MSDHAFTTNRIDWIDAIFPTRLTVVLAIIFVSVAVLSTPQEGTAQEKGPPAREAIPRGGINQQAAQSGDSPLGLNWQLNSTAGLPRQEERRSAPDSDEEESLEKSIELHGGLALTKAGFGFTGSILVRQGERGGAVRGVLTQGLLGGSYREGGLLYKGVFIEEKLNGSLAAGLSVVRLNGSFGSGLEGGTTD